MTKLMNFEEVLIAELEHQARMVEKGRVRERELIADAQYQVAESAPDLLAALEGVEWTYEYAGLGMYVRACPWCHTRMVEGGHHPLCARQLALKKARGE